MTVRSTAAAIRFRTTPRRSGPTWLPTHGAIIALRAATSGGPGLTGGIVELAAWLVVGTPASIVVTDRRRYRSTRQNRLQARPLTA